MATTRYLISSYASAYDALTQIDAWLVGAMGYTRNLAPTSDTVTYTGYKAHYQYTFATGETIYLNFHTDTTNGAIYLNCSRSYSSSLAWNAQIGAAAMLSGAIGYAKVTVPVSASNNALYMFGDALGNCQVFFQRGNALDVSDLLQWGKLDKSGFGAWTGGCYFSGWNMASTTISASCSSPCLIYGSADSSVPHMFIDVTASEGTFWASVKSFNQNPSAISREPSSTIGTTSSTWTGMHASADVSGYDGYLIAGESFATPMSINTFTVQDDISGYLCNMTGRIHMYSPILYIRREVSQKITAIGRIPFGYHCPVASYPQYVAPGTELVRDSRTFVLMGNIAAEKVSV